MKYKLVINDYIGHPFIFDLAKELSKCDYAIDFVYTSASTATKANFDHQAANLNVVDVKTTKINKSNFILRFIHEYKYARILQKTITKLNPDLIISANTPLLAQNLLFKWAKKQNKVFIFWLQDLNALATKLILSDKYGKLGELVSLYFTHLEKSILQGSNHIITITKDFDFFLNKLGIDKNKITIIENWAPIRDIPVVGKVNDFSLKHSLDKKFVVLYSGNLGFKQYPELLVELAKSFKNDSDIKFVVVSEGMGMDFLRQKKKEENLHSLILLPFQPFQEIPNVLGSADIILTTLNKNAGIYSVPSKVWSGLCAARTNILVAPENNLASKTLKKNDIGLVFQRNELSKIIDCIKDLKNNPANRSKIGDNARKYAELNFEISNIAPKFDLIFKDALSYSE